MKKAFCVIILPVLLLGGCKKGGTTHDVAWFAAHPAEREKTMQSCQNDPEESAEDAECINAKQAEQNAILDPHNTSTPKF